MLSHQWHQCHLVSSLLIFTCLATNFCTKEQLDTPFRLSHHSFINCVWYPAASFVEPNHHCYHQSLQASFISSISSLSAASPLNRANAFPTPRKAKLVLLYLSILLITQSCDTESNPGPYTPKYPCGVCTKAVRWSRTRTAIACDTCDSWYHTDCMGMSSVSYDRLNRSSVSWICAKCDTPNHSSSLLDSYITDTDNQFDALSSMVSEPDLSHQSTQGASLLSNNSASSNNSQPSSNSFATSSDIGSPLQRSSPIKKPKRRKNSWKSLKVLSVNLQSANAKKDAFWLAVESSKPDIIIANETWLNPSKLSSEIMPPGYNSPIRRDRPDGYGGVLLATKNDLIDCEIKIVSESECEIVATKIEMYKQRPLIVLSIYRPTNNNLIYAQQLCQSIRDIAAKFPTATIWLSGDFNLPDINWQTESIERHQYPLSINQCFLKLFHDLGLTQIVDFPTRFDRTLDLFLTNRPSLVNKCVPLPGVSDHEMVLAVADVAARHQKPVRRKIHLWKKADLPTMKNLLSKFSTDFIASNSIVTPIDDMWNQLSAKLQEILTACVPSKMTTTRFNQPWINGHLKRLARRKKKAFRKAKRTRSLRDHTRYKHLKKQMQADCRKTYDTYVANMICDDSSGKSKKLWSFIKSKRCDNSGVAPLMKNGVLKCDSTTKANILNDQFVSVFTDEQTTSLPDLGPAVHPEVPNFSISVAGIEKLLSNLKPFTATGPDNIPAYLLKEGANELAPALSLLFEASLHQGKIPHSWKTADVSPIFKKGDRHRPENYRPISLTSIICKLLEHVVHKQIISHLDTNGLLTDRQFGFRKKRSCESQLLLTVNDLAEGLRDKEQVDAILLDFSKAFDRVPHERLLLKLHHLGVRGVLLDWVRDFLSGRSQQVVLEGKRSQTAKVTSGVPQGTVLGPLLFLVFINDMPDSVTSNIRLFADDALLYRSIKSHKDAEALQKDLDALQSWEKTWQMSFNPDKCEVLRVTKKRKIINSEYSIHGTALRIVDEAKYLGVTIQKNLSWKPHINNISKKANSTRGFLQRNLRRCPAAVKEQAYKTYVRPTLDFASSVWDPHQHDLINQLEMVQRRAARSVKSDFNPRHSVTKMLQDLQWSTLRERRAHNKAIMMYRIVNCLVAIPSGPPIFIPSGDSTRGHCMQFVQLHCRILAYQHSFFPSGICLWNNLPDQVVSAASLAQFRSKLSHVTLH